MVTEREQETTIIATKNNVIKVFITGVFGLRDKRCKSKDYAISVYE